jgi:hypothetical protein
MAASDAEERGRDEDHRYRSVSLQIPTARGVLPVLDPGPARDEQHPPPGQAAHRRGHRRVHRGARVPGRAQGCARAPEGLPDGPRPVQGRGVHQDLPQREGRRRARVVHGDSALGHHRQGGEPADLPPARRVSRPGQGVRVDRRAPPAPEAGAGRPRHQGEGVPRHQAPHQVRGDRRRTRHGRYTASRTTRPGTPSAPC